MIVNGGKYFIRECIAGNIDDWFAGDNSKRYMGAGTSTNTNAGIVGPVGTTYPALTGNYQGAANSDFKLSNEVTTTRPEISFSIGNQGFVHVRALFNSANFASDDDFDLTEFGIFLAESGVPGNSPVDFPSGPYKEGAMIARIVNIYPDSIVGVWKHYLAEKKTGVPLIYNFDIVDFGI